MPDTNNFLKIYPIFAYFMAQKKPNNGCMPSKIKSISPPPPPFSLSSELYLKLNVPFNSCSDLDCLPWRWVRLHLLPPQI